MCSLTRIQRYQHISQELCIITPNIYANSVAAFPEAFTFQLLFFYYVLVSSFLRKEKLFMFGGGVLEKAGGKES